ncbi:hypothetical protein PR048_021085 [Dryococelus australis]|uniref:Uncharacterized protein n=1 Tax=Dryococelus australis TaxID=614101 RepID=A0ABQ9GXA1_9NEOP|nr:hypothetical protein PR048_021085 [Dryococelus australis]
MEVGYDQVVAFVSDSASHMKSCFDGLSILESLWCFGQKQSELNQLGVSVKQIFFNARKKLHAFQFFFFLQQASSKAGFFPIPFATRWNSWLTFVE